MRAFAEGDVCLERPVELYFQPGPIVRIYTEIKGREAYGSGNTVGSLEAAT